jgi:hypothetical protein
MDSAMLFSRASSIFKMGFHAYLARIRKVSRKMTTIQNINPKSGLSKSIIYGLLVDNEIVVI